MATIMVVDDELGIRELLSEILSDEGHNVILADNAQAAKQYRDKEVPDLVLLDIWMPGMDGLTLLREWNIRKQLNMPVIMMSGHATIDTAVEATKIGAIHYLEKPISLQKLLDAVEQALSRPFRLQSVPPLSHETPTDSHALSHQNHWTATTSPVDIQISHQVPSTEITGHFQQIPFNLPLRAARDIFEKAYLEYHLQQEKGVMTKVAQKTGLERTHLYRKLRQLGIEMSKEKSESET